MNTPILTTLQEKNAPWNQLDNPVETKVDVEIVLKKTLTLHTPTDFEEDILQAVDNVIDNEDFNSWKVDNVEVTKTY